MKAPVIWLKDFTDIDVSAKELGDALTMSGSKVEEIIDYKLSGVVAGKILTVAEHPEQRSLAIYNYLHRAARSLVTLGRLYQRIV